MYDFTEKILPKYYNHNNYASFIRQLNKYNFHKIKSSTSDNAFQNNQFIKGKKDLISNILRKKKRKRDIEPCQENITSLVKYKKNNFLCDLNTLGKNYENKNNLSFDKRSLSLEEENENSNNNINTNNLFIRDNQTNNFIRYNSNSPFIPYIHKQMNSLILKQNLMKESTDNKINEHQKISKKTVNDLLNDIVNKSEKISKKQKTLNAKFDSLSRKYKEYIDKSNIYLKEIESKNENDNKLDKLISFIVEFKNNNLIKNRLLPESINNNPKSESSDSLLNNLEIINSADHLKEGNKSDNSKDCENKKKFSNEYGSFQSFFNQYFEKKKHNGLLTSSENKPINNSINNIEQKNNNSLFISKNSNVINVDNISKMNDSFSKEKFNFERGNSMDNFSTIFKRNRSNSFHSSYSNNITDNLNNNDNMFFGNNNQNDYNINNRSEIIWNNNINSNGMNNNLNKSFDGEFFQDKNSFNKDSLNNSSYSFIDIQNKN